MIEEQTALIWIARDLVAYAVEHGGNYPLFWAVGSVTFKAIVDQIRANAKVLDRGSCQALYAVDGGYPDSIRVVGVTVYPVRGAINETSPL